MKKLSITGFALFLVIAAAAGALTGQTADPGLTEHLNYPITQGADRPLFCFTCESFPSLSKHEQSLIGKIALHPKRAIPETSIF